MPRITIDSQINLKIPEVEKAVSEAVRLGLRDTIVAIQSDAMQLSRKKTGHNMRSIASEVSGMGTVAQGDDAEPEHVVDDSKDEAACYSSSGYGGYLETGWRMVNGRLVGPFPYFRPAFDMHSDELVPNIQKHLESVK